MKDHSVEEIEEEEEKENENTNENLPETFNFQRVTTDYGEEDGFDDEVFEEVLNRYLNFCYSLLFFFLLLQFHLLYEIPVYLPVFPLLGLEIFMILNACIKYKQEHELIQSLWRTGIFRDILNSSGSILAYVLFIVYALKITGLVFTAGIPKLAAVVLKVVIKTSTVNVCASFVNIVMPIQVNSIAEWIEVFSIFTIGLKIDGILNYSWSVVLWPIWVGVVGCVIIIMSLIVLIALSCCSNEAQVDNIYCTLWLLYFFMAGLCAAATSVYMINLQIKTALLVPVGYLAVFILLTKILKKKLAVWWKDMLYNESGSSLIMFRDEAPLPLPPSQIDSILSQKITHAIKFTPKALVLLTRRTSVTNVPNSYNKRHNKTQSYSLESNISVSHKRSKSSISISDSSNVSDAQKLCTVCLKNTQNTFAFKCGHGNICYACKEKKIKTTNCSLCKQGIDVDSI